MKAAVAAAVKGLKPAEEVDDFEAGPSDDEEEAELSGSSGGGSGGSESEGEEQGVSGSEEEDDDFGSDDGVEDGMEGLSSGEAQEDGEEGSSGNDSDDEEGGFGRRQQPGGGFLEGAKAASFAKAFAKIVEGSGKKAAEAVAATAQQAAAAPAAIAAAAAAPILATSRSIAKRKAEEAEEAKADREAKKLRQEMKQRGHVVPKRRGQDPEGDAREKGLQRLATKGVVRLFNAIAKAQKQLREAEEATGSRAKAVKLGKASFLAQLKGSGAVATGAKPGEALVPSAPARQVAATAAAAPAAKQRRRAAAAAAADSSDDEDAAGWDVLKQGFVGLQGGSKMKDWDKQESDEEGPDGDSLQGMSSGDDDE
ncbi:hypothetical protein ABPG75_004248 [Micractinium tetrahymenae]